MNALYQRGYELGRAGYDWRAAWARSEAGLVCKSPGKGRER